METLEGAQIFENGDDTLLDKHGCPAYVSPEVLNHNSYSGRAADCWSLGVILYTMLVGRYPFHDNNPSVVFLKIRRGVYTIPEDISYQACSLILSLIKVNPEHRLKAEDALGHRWFNGPVSENGDLMKRVHAYHPRERAFHDTHWYNYAQSVFEPSSATNVPEHTSPVFPEPSTVLANLSPLLPPPVRAFGTRYIIASRYTNPDQIVPDLGDDR